MKVRSFIRAAARFLAAFLLLTGIAKSAVEGRAATGAAAGLVDAGSSGSDSGTAGSGFDDLWHDGKAEVDAYRLSIVRYGTPRHGQAVLIYVTEPFSRSKHVKLDDPAKSPADVFEALKLNVVRRFQTGVYDYNTMVSLFTRAEDFAPIKVSFTSAEWCGHVYEQMDFEGTRVTSTLESYFENESGKKTLEPPAGAVEEDALFILLRGLRGEFMAPGETRQVPFLPSPFIRRLAHRPLESSTASIERLARPETTRVQAGTFRTIVYVVRPADGREGRFSIEADSPHRLVRWAWTRPGGVGGEGPGRSSEGLDSGELIGSDRIAYWRLHDPGDEKILERLGLQPRTR